MIQANCHNVSTSGNEYIIDGFTLLINSTIFSCPASVKQILPTKNPKMIDLIQILRNNKDPLIFSISTSPTLCFLLRILTYLFIKIDETQNIEINPAIVPHTPAINIAKIHSI
ncbi:hypothetical protein ES708_08348 [subsurface metagenome]